MNEIISPDRRDRNRARVEAIEVIAAACVIIGWLVSYWVESPLMRSIVSAALGM